MQKILGQTLIEVMITVLIIGVGALSLVRFQNYLTYSDMLAKQEADANRLALSKMEQLRDFQSLSTQSGMSAYEEITSGTETNTLTNTVFTTTWTVTTNSSPDYKIIAIIVSWNDLRGSAHTVNLTSNIAEFEPLNSALIMRATP